MEKPRPASRFFIPTWPFVVAAFLAGFLFGPEVPRLTPLRVHVVSYETNRVTVTNRIFRTQEVLVTNFVHRVVDWNITNYHRVEIPVRVTNTIWMKRYMPPKYPEDWFGYESPHSPWVLYTVDGKCGGPGTVFDLSPGTHECSMIVSSCSDF